MMTLTADDAGAVLTATWDGQDLFHYVYQPRDPQLESPRPYFHPLATLGGDVVSCYRPHDHVWHKGLALSLPNVGPDNFWGGPSFHDGGYVQLPNDGAMRHQAFDQPSATDSQPSATDDPVGTTDDEASATDGQAGANDGRVRVTETLSWITEAGRPVISERRQLTVTAWPAEQAWGLGFETVLVNTTSESIVFGSPTTEGRPNAGYGGLFWRGPRSFTGGRVTVPGAVGGDELMGRRAPWLAFTGQHDEHGRWSTLVFADDPANFSFPSQWFVRSTPFAAVCPAPFFDKTHELPAGQELVLRYGLAIADGDRDASGCARLAELAGDLA
ncbi:MAG TPA: PmoA family protein [Trebonia sp.]|nr:PmoA family protein [Trebonia sp.]